MTDDVPDGQREVATGQPERVVPVAADLELGRGRQVTGLHLQPTDSDVGRRGWLGQHRVLQRQ